VAGFQNEQLEAKLILKFVLWEIYSVLSITIGLKANHKVKDIVIMNRINPARGNKFGQKIIFTSTFDGSKLSGTTQPLAQLFTKTCL